MPRAPAPGRPQALSSSSPRRRLRKNRPSDWGAAGSGPRAAPGPFVLLGVWKTQDEQALRLRCRGLRPQSEMQPSVHGRADPGSVGVGPQAAGFGA